MTEKLLTGTLSLNTNKTLKSEALAWPCSLHYQLHIMGEVAERLALPTSDHGVAGSNPAGGKIFPGPKQCFIAQNF